MKKRIILLLLLALAAFILPFLFGGKSIIGQPQEKTGSDSPSPAMPVIEIDVPETEGTHTFAVTPSPSPAFVPTPELSEQPIAVPSQPANTNHANAPSAGAVQKGSAFALTIQKQTVQVLPSVDEKSLEQAPGWLDTSVAPGEEGICVVYGHRNRHHFKFLKGLDCGDTITVTMPDGKIWNYVVESTEILNSDSVLRIPTIIGKHLILTTCYPFYYTGHAPKKFVVIASLVQS